MGREADRQALIDLIINAKRTDPETGSFTEWLADFLLGYGVTLPQPSNEPLTCEGCYWERKGGFGQCFGCLREKSDNYRRPPEREEDT